MSDKTQQSALSALIILQLVMLFSLYFQIPPHPPQVIPIGGMAPFLAASLAVAWAALVFRAEGRVGAGLTVLACLMAGVSFGPQKYLDDAIGLVWPAVVSGQIAILVLLFSLVRRSGTQLAAT